MSGKTCQKQNHNQDYLYLNWIDDKQNFLQCAKCITEDESPSFKKILISDILNDKYNLEQVNNWPPLGNKQLTEFAHYICKKIQENPGVENLMNHLIQNRIDDYFDQQTEEICQKLNSLKKKVKIQFQNTIEEFIEKNKEDGEPNIEDILSGFKIEDFRQKIEEFLNDK
ncbi:hypothetical protein PPERSA_02259 [Pseudocohnilembus persalinus]|uniref:Uncharacterized protein n=1 Tax=Pseudocohnilembus persalinus TaxID=266149 RepID=A0A0V0QKT6_PSEPJ|nr:hypothetical protein PPERSA_02259 [Pseudocohnilembus persalinus]|eukprot:KRX02769.1 hypothetical protein PPERSA_02259 [Pseudocohnilembus persalinus]